MVKQILFFCAGLGLLTIGAEFLVRGASRLAMRFGVPAIVVGLTIVAYGTSTPELIVSVKAALQGQADLSLGNVIGSNIFNVLLILGASSCIVSLIVSRKMIWQEVPIMIALSTVVYLLGLDGRISRPEGALLVLFLIGYSWFQIRQGLRIGRQGESTYEKDQEFKSSHAAKGKSIVWIMMGLLVLVLGARWLLDSSVSIARYFGLNELIIGLTIVAAGTSLPEVATSIIASLRGERDIAVGNVVGSNIFNIAGVLGLSAFLSPTGVKVSAPAMSFDIPVMIATAVACLPIFLTGHKIDRWEGIVFLFYYIAYTIYLILDVRHHESLPIFSATMMMFVIPLTVLTLGVFVYRHFHLKRD